MITRTVYFVPESVRSIGGKMKTITLRTGSGIAIRSVKVVSVEKIGFKKTHNGDGSYLKCKAVGVDGSIYETKSKGGGWRKI